MQGAKSNVFLISETYFILLYFNHTQRYLIKIFCFSVMKIISDKKETFLYSLKICINTQKIVAAKFLPRPPVL